MHESAGPEFFPLIFEFVRQKYDDEYAFLPTHHLSFEVMQHFKQVCCILWPGMFLNTREFNMVPGVQCLTRKQDSQDGHLILSKIVSTAI